MMPYVVDVMLSNFKRMADGNLQQAYKKLFSVYLSKAIKPLGAFVQMRTETGGNRRVIAEGARRSVNLTDGEIYGTIRDVCMQNAFSKMS